MTQKKSNKSKDVVQEGLINDKKFLKVMVEKVCQRIMEDEMTMFLGADPHQRTDDRAGYRTNTNQGS